MIENVGTIQQLIDGGYDKKELMKLNKADMINALLRLERDTKTFQDLLEVFCQKEGLELQKNRIKTLEGYGIILN